MNKRFNGYNLAHVDMDTGEVLCETSGCTYISDGHPSEECEQVEIDDFCEDIPFLMLHELMDELAERLTPMEFVFFMRLTKYVSYTDCVIRKTSHGNSTPMSMKDMASILGYDYSNVRKMVSSLKKKGLVGKHETGSIGIDSKAKKVYTINPYIYRRGKTVNKFVAEFYEDSGWKELLYNLYKTK